MTIDPKAAELAKALADAVAAQETEEYQALAKAAKQKDEIDAMAEKAAFELREHYAPKVGQGSGSYLGSPRPTPEPGFCTPGIDASIFGPPSSDPAHYELPEDEDPQWVKDYRADVFGEDETATAKPNGGLSD